MEKITEAKLSQFTKSKLKNLKTCFKNEKQLMINLSLNCMDYLNIANRQKKIPDDDDEVFCDNYE